MPRVVPLVLIAWLCGAATVAFADTDRQAAADHFRRGEAAEKAKRYREAIDEYERAYTLVPHADVLFNIAVNYEHLEQWADAADLFQRYLDERETPAADADAVNVRIRDLRAKVKPPVEHPVIDPHDPQHDRQHFDDPRDPQVDDPHTGDPHTGDRPHTGEPFIGTVVPSPVPHWHLGASYGIGFGDAPTERYLAHGGVQVSVFELDAIGGSFGKNDYAVGGMGRIVLLRDKHVSPFARAALTVGYAKQDASSTAGTRIPIGLEAGGGLQLGGHGWFEVGLALRWLRGGWDAASTTADSFVNDDFAVAIDLGFAFDSAITTIATSVAR